MSHKGETVLFVGNGFNQVSDKGAAWKALLNKLAGPTSDPHEESVRAAKPFTLWFEELSSHNGTKPLKDIIADRLKVTERLLFNCIL